MLEDDAEAAAAKPPPPRALFEARRKPLGVAGKGLAPPPARGGSRAEVIKARRQPPLLVYAHAIPEGSASDGVKDGFKEGYRYTPPEAEAQLRAEAESAAAELAAESAAAMAAADAEEAARAAEAAAAAGEDADGLPSLESEAEAARRRLVELEASRPPAASATTPMPAGATAGADSATVTTDGSGGQQASSADDERLIFHQGVKVHVGETLATAGELGIVLKVYESFTGGLDVVQQRLRFECYWPNKSAVESAELLGEVRSSVYLVPGSVMWHRRIASLLRHYHGTM